MTCLLCVNSALIPSGKGFPRSHQKRKQAAFELDYGHEKTRRKAGFRQCSRATFNLAGKASVLFFCIGCGSKDGCADIPQGNRNTPDIHGEDPGDRKQAGTCREQDQDDLKIRQVQGTVRLFEGILRHEFDCLDEGNKAIRLPVYKFPGRRPMRQIATSPAPIKCTGFTCNSGVRYGMSPC